MELDATLISMAASVISAIIVATFAYVNKKGESKVMQRAEIRKTESRLLLKMIEADSKLTYAVAMAVKRGTANGEVEEGIEAFKKATEEYDEFLRNVAREGM